MHWIYRYIPLLPTLKNYKKHTFRADILAGLTTAVLLIPQGMGYAMLAGLPPIYGLYSSVLPLLIYALFGSSRQLAIGPVAMVSLLVLSGVSTIAEPGTESFITYAILLSLMVGIIQTTMGLARLGFLVNFLSHPVISGFTSAAALIIGFSQLKYLLGFEIPRSHYIHTIFLTAIQNISETHLITFVLGLVSLAVLLIMKRLFPLAPRALIVVFLSSLLVWIFELNTANVAIVGDIPKGFPGFRSPVLDWQAIKALWPIALTISFVGFMESIAVAKKYASLENYEIKANQELFGLGLANIFGSFTLSYPVTGGFSRTAVNAQAGAKTNIATIVTAMIVALTLLFLTSLFYFLPNTVLAAIIMSAVFGLIDIQEVKHLWKVKRSDFSMLVITFTSTLIFGIEQGILFGVGASLLVMIFHSTRPHLAVIGRLPNSRTYRNIQRFPEAETLSGVLAIRLDSQFYFGNVNFLKESLNSLEQNFHKTLHVVILDASGLNQIDTSGETALRDMVDNYKSRGIRFVMTSIKGPVRDVLKRSGFFQVLGEENDFLCTDDAVEALSTEGMIWNEQNISL